MREPRVANTFGLPMYRMYRVSKFPRFHVMIRCAAAAADWIPLAASCGCGAGSTIPAPGVRSPQRFRKVRLRSRVQPLQDQGNSSSVSQTDWGIGEVIFNGMFEHVVK